MSAEGEFDIYQGTKFQRTFGPGVAFGEIALLYNTKRLRSIGGKAISLVGYVDTSRCICVRIDDRAGAVVVVIRYCRGPSPVAVERSVRATIAITILFFCEQLRNPVRYGYWTDRSF